MPYVELKGNIFNSDAQSYVNTVNCMGVMGKGIALEFRRRFPSMYEEYKSICLNDKLRPGQIWAYKYGDRWILNFAIKKHWKFPSRAAWIDMCLNAFTKLHKDLKIHSVAFPWMGAMNGGLPLPVIQGIMRTYLRNLADIKVEVYNFDPEAADPLFRKLKQITTNMPVGKFSELSKIRLNKVATIYDCIISGQIPSLTKLCESKILGTNSIDKLYIFLTNYLANKYSPAQVQLFT